MDSDFQQTGPGVYEKDEREIVADVATPNPISNASAQRSSNDLLCARCSTALLPRFLSSLACKSALDILLVVRKKSRARDRNFFYDNQSARAICNFADEHLWFSSGLRRVSFCKLLRDSRRPVPLAQCDRRSAKSRAC